VLCWSGLLKGALASIYLAVTVAASTSACHKALVQHHHFELMTSVVGSGLLLWPDVLTFNVCPAGCNVLDFHFAKVSDDRYGAFVELESEEDVKLALSRSHLCVNATYSDLYGRVFGMFSSSLSVS